MTNHGVISGSCWDSLVAMTCDTAVVVQLVAALQSHTPDLPLALALHRVDNESRVVSIPSLCVCVFLMF